MANPARIPTLSTTEGLSYSLSQVLPNYTGGLFTPNPFWFGFKKYQSDYLYLKLMGKKSLLVLDLAGIRTVLDNSPELFAEPKIKRQGMSYFQPNALTISRGADWRERRTFNEAVLASGQSLHPNGEHFLDLIRQEVKRLQLQPAKALVWDDFALLFQRLTLQIIFGQGTTDTSLTDELQDLMRTANRGFLLKKSRKFDAFYRRLHDQLKQARNGSLAERCTQVPSTANTEVENQVPHWIFAMADTLAINCARALALIAAHPDREKQLRQEMQAVDLSSPTGINQLNFLEGCVQEAMRLWPTTPMLVRETVQATELGGEQIPAGTQIIILNSFNHRDQDKLSVADKFAPEIWQEQRADYRFNHLSNGKQVCAGKDLALFIAKGVLANLLENHRYKLVRPGLNRDEPLPYRYNHFHLEFMRQYL